MPALPCSLRLGDRWRVGDTDSRVHGSPSKQVNNDYLVLSCTILSPSAQAEMPETRSYVEAVDAVDAVDAVELKD